MTLSGSSLAQAHATPPGSLAKARSGIAGFDEITEGGLPRGRASLICGGPGCGKTLFGIEFLVRGITQFGEPGVFVSFEETAEELRANVESLGFDLAELQERQQLAIDHVRVERAEIEEAGEYDLEGLFVRLQAAIESVGAKRVVLDTIESLFSGLPNPATVRSEIRRLFRWLKDRELTVLITAEQGSGTLTRDGLEEYVSDCVIFLDHRVVQQASTRRLRVIKYRGSVHGTNEYPFLIDESGISVLPITSLGLAHAAPKERVSSGVVRLDEMLFGGYFKGSTVLVSGTAGTGKTTLAAALALDGCKRGGTCLYVAHEESPEQIVRNMQSVGLDLEPALREGRLHILASRPTAHGLERHLVNLHKAVRQFEPSITIVDPVSNLTTVEGFPDAFAMVTRVVDFLKTRGSTALLTSLASGSDSLEETAIGISSIVDTWILLSVVRINGERNRTLSVVKSRGMAHSNQAAEFVLSDKGITLRDTYTGPGGGVLTGSARLVKEAEEAAATLAAAQDIERKQKLRERRRAIVEAQIAALREQLAADETELEREIAEDERRRGQVSALREAVGKSRHEFYSTEEGNGKGS